MHILFVHQNYPAQFGAIAATLAKEEGYRCTFISMRPPGKTAGVERIQYKPAGGATPNNHFCSRTFENQIWNAHGVFETLKGRPDIQPDLIVGHSGFASTLFLSELYDCPIINYFEYFYRTKNSDMDFRPEFPSNELTRLRAKARNALLLLDLEFGDAAYSPTQYQKSLFPKAYQDKIQCIFDGIDTNIWKPKRGIEKINSENEILKNRIPENKINERKIGDIVISDNTKIITYVSRGFESMRGFDIFMKIAKRLCDMRSDVVFAIVGDDRICYGGDEKFIGNKSFKQWVLSQDDYDMKRIIFTGVLPTQQLADLLAISDLHIYLTVPFVLSWSLMDALACGATVLASNTAPVREMITHEKNGLLVDFYDVDGFVREANRVLDDPNQFRFLGEAGVKLIQKDYSLDVCLSKMKDFYKEVVKKYKILHSS